MPLIGPMSAMNIFLKQCVLRGGLPFPVELPEYKKEVIDAMKQAKELSKSLTAKRYNSFAEAMEDVDEVDE